MAAEFYHKNLFAEEYKEALQYITNRNSKEIIEEFQIGYAPSGWDKLLNNFKETKVKEEVMIGCRLICQSEKNNKLFDFYRQRIVFPIHNYFGEIIGFVGRYLEIDGQKDEKQPKYINSPDSLIYNKSDSLFGYYQAKEHILKYDCCNIVEGPTDVLKLHENNIKNTVAHLGTSLTEQQIQSIKKLTKNINLIYDGDKAGQKATIRSGEKCLAADCNIIVIPLPDKEDPSSFFKSKEHFSDYFKEVKINFIHYIADNLLTQSDTDPVLKANSINEICKTIALIPDKVKQDSFLDFIVKTFKKSHNISKKTFSGPMAKYSIDPEIEKKKEMDSDSLPKELTKEEKWDYIKYTFYEYKNQYFFKDKSYPISNFVMIPLFHIRSINETRKLFEIVNIYNVHEIIEVDMQAMNSLIAYRKAVESKGNFLWEGNDLDFMKLKRKLYDKTRYCWKIDRLGWQKEGFYAFANGIIHNATFTPIDENGIVKYKEEHYYIPAYSSIYMSDNSIFKDERKFIYSNKKTISLREWAQRFIDVYEKQSILSICFYLTALFSDFLFYKLSNLPILNFFGPKGCGKNEQAMSLLTLFGEPQNELQIHNATKPGISAFLEQLINAICWIDEYKNAMAIENIEMIKAIYNRNGRTRGSIKEGVSKEVTPIDSMVILTGQEMPTADIALFSRTIHLPYNKTEHTEEEKKKFNQLKQLQEGGLTNITFEVLKYREIIEKNYSDTFHQVEVDLIKKTTQAEKIIDDRIMRNVITVITTFKCLENYIDFPFTYETVLDIAFDNINHHNEQMTNSNELSQFWKKFEMLVEREIIKNEFNFRIEILAEVNLNIGTKAYIKNFNPSQHLLFVKWAGIYQLYAEHCKKAGENPLPENTLLYYMENSKPFIGKKKSVRFENSVNQAMVFNYETLQILGLNLIRFTSNEARFVENDDIKTVKEDQVSETKRAVPMNEDLPF
jgi:DNA primase